MMGPLPSGACGVRILGTGSAVPDRRLTNADIEKLVDTNDAWIVERTGQPVPRVGALLVLIDMGGRPTLLLRTRAVREAVFGKVTAEDTAVDGSPVRDPAIWVPLHTVYWNALLEPFGLTVSDDMPFWVEAFELLYDADAGRST